jgi:hypothetical protein
MQVTVLKNRKFGIKKPLLENPKEVLSEQSNQQQIML